MTEYAMPKVGDVIAGKYRLEKVAGEGGMGIVYAAQHLVLKQRVAVKVLLPDAASSELVVERFAREAQAAARIMSEHVSRVMDAGETATGAPFLVMEYLEGCDLEELLSVEGPLPQVDVVDYLMQALEALAHAHAVGLVHRDIKPANLFLACRSDGGNVIKMLDFGISKTVTMRPEDKVLTGQALLGSPVYMSPEQLRNAKDIDARADIWSIGVVAYELLTGKPPFDGDGVGEIFAAILEKDAPPLHTVSRQISVELSRVVARCIRRKPEERWSDAAELLKELAPFGSGTWNHVIDRAELVLSRARMLKVPATPPSARRVVDAIALVAERARTTGGTEALRHAPALPAKKKVDHASAPLQGSAARGDAREAGDRAEAAPKGSLHALTWQSPLARAVAAVAAAVVVVGAALAVASLRSGFDPALEPRAPITASVMSVEGKGDPGAPHNAATQGAPAAEGEGENAPPMVMDLPDTPGQTAGGSRARSAKPGKPQQRPKFLNSRE